MTRNVGMPDRVLRAILGAVLLYLPLFSGLPLFEGAIATYAALAVGVVLLGSAALGVCPLYRVLGIRTCEVRK